MTQEYRGKKRQVRVEGKMRNTTVEEGLWEAFTKAVEEDPLKLYTNNSDAMRGLIREYVKEVENRKERGE